MNWVRWLAALFVTLALAGCAQAVPGQAHAPYAPYSPENNGNMHDSGGAVVEALAVACSRRDAGELRRRSWVGPSSPPHW